MQRCHFLTYSVAALAALLAPAQSAETAERTEYAALGRRIGTSDVAAVRQITAAFSSADERSGGSNGRTAVVQYLVDDVNGYLRGTFATHDVREQIFGAAAEPTYLAGFKAHDASQDGQAQRWCLCAYQLACESDPGAHAGYVPRILAHHAFDIDIGATNPDPRLPRSAGPKPRWTAHATTPPPAESRSADPPRPARPAAGTPSPTPRIHALTAADLASVHCARGSVEQACQTWTSAMTEMDGIDSARTRTAVSSMRAELASFRRRGVHAAARLDQQAAAWQTSNA